MKTLEINMYNALKPSLGEEDAQVFVEAYNESVAAKIEIMKSDLATKGDLHAFRNELKGDMHALRNELKDDMSTFKDELKEDMRTLRNEFKGDINALLLNLTERTGKHHVECMRGIYVTGLIQLTIIIGSVLAIIRASI